mgnify:FL=1
MHEIVQIILAFMSAALGLYLMRIIVGDFVIYRKFRDQEIFMSINSEKPEFGSIKQSIFSGFLYFHNIENGKNTTLRPESVQYNGMNDKNNIRILHARKRF